MRYLLAGAAILLVHICGASAFAADPTTADCLASSDASLKLGNQHKLRAERSQLLVCAAATCPEDVRKDCLSRVDLVNAEIPTIVFSAKDASGADLSAVRVSMDGEVLAERLEGTSLSIDPGEHTFLLETAGQPARQKTFVLLQGQKDRREAIVFDGPTSLAPADASAPSAPATESGHGLGTQRVLALVAGGIGVVGLGLGGAFGALAVSKKNDAQRACPASQCTTQDGVNKWSDAGSAGNVSTIGFIVGGVALAGAAVLWFTAPGGERRGSAQVGVGLGSVQLRGTF